MAVSLPRQGGVPGGYNDADPQDPQVKEAMKVFDDNLHTAFPDESNGCLKDLHAFSQVVNGMNYKFVKTFQKVVSGEDCSVAKGLMSKCTGVVYSSRDGRKSVTSLDCKHV
ncbi:hypothetical protein PT974_03218 [Cladobotryum mycophilum]|uniref:Uncharacterized protein n=1 Tax=Cladobotryum mycophilum TaxID=491253 RepID=A0ABR0SSB8_9HYPO